MPAPVLSHAVVAPSCGAPERYVLFLHGVFGSGANLRSLARRLVEARPSWGAVLVDVRLHGGSQGLPPPHTVDAAASDLVALEAALPGPVEAVVGHSLGGKITLAYVAQRGGDLANAWVLDASPGPRPDARGSETIVRVLEALEATPSVLPTRDAFHVHLAARGIDEGLRAWLAMNVRPDGDGYRVRLDLAGIRALVEDYWIRDLWPVVEAPPGRVRLDLVVGGRSRVFDEADRARLEALARASAGRVHAHELPSAGHWVHVDDPEGLFALLSAAF